ncbi:MAG: hypothetical protein IJS79_02935 [Oscillospiraceae bacterium]|nr:hypothetical protein [Oscillospiraceae bacterium]
MDNEQSSLFRKESVDHIQSPEQLSDYMRVTNPSVWVVLIAVIVLLAGMLVWSAAAQIDSFAPGVADVRDGEAVMIFDDAQVAKNVETGMMITIGENEYPIASVGYLEDGNVFATAAVDLNDGLYQGRVVFRRTQVLRLLFN